MSDVREEQDRFTIEGEPCSLSALCRSEPEWAANRIRVLESEVARLTRERDALREMIDGAGGCGTCEGCITGQNCSEVQPGLRLQLQTVRWDLETHRTRAIELARENAALRAKVELLRLGCETLGISYGRLLKWVDASRAAQKGQPLSGGGEVASPEYVERVKHYSERADMRLNGQMPPREGGGWVGREEGADQSPEAR